MRSKYVSILNCYFQLILNSLKVISIYYKHSGQIVEWCKELRFNVQFFEGCGFE